MTTGLLLTKLYFPPLRPNLVPRPHLIARLNQGYRLGHKLALISAPAGFGKSTLAAAWLSRQAQVASGEWRVASKEPGHNQYSQTPDSPPTFSWLALDESDSDPARFLTYFIAALDQDGSVGRDALALLEARPTLLEPVLTSLINDLTTLPGRIILVLDDFHLVESAAVDEALTFLLAHLPPQLHLVITTREDPNLPLSRLRARGRLTELRAGDLRFTPAESAEFLNEVMGLDLTAGEIAALDTRTEGWIAGLQLAALSMRGRRDSAGFIQAFTGSHHFVLDYLVEEVLGRQPADVRSFLLQTSILDSLSGPLCDAVTGREDGRKMLESLARGNLFVLPLDDQRQWYRYHHLFAGVLQARALELQPDQLPALHQRACTWYEQNGRPYAAIRHALAAGDYRRAAGLLELEARPTRRATQGAAWLGSVQALPQELLRSMPILSTYLALALMPSDLDAAAGYLRDAERLLEMPPDRNEQTAEIIVVNEEERPSLPGTIAIARAYLAGATGDTAASMEHARRAGDLLPEYDYLWRGAAAALLGIAYWTSGDLEAAYSAISEAKDILLKSGDISSVMGGAFLMGDIRISQGRLREAAATCLDGLQFATLPGEPVYRGTADLHVLLGELALEQNDLEAVAEHLRQSQELGEPATTPEMRHRPQVFMSRIKVGEGDLDGALALLDEAERRYIGGPNPDVRPLAAMKAQLWVAQGRLDEAWNWARAQGLALDDDLSFLREFEHITLARLLIARHKNGRPDHSWQEIVDFLERLLQAAEAGGRSGSAIEILLLLASMHQVQGNIVSTLDALERALALAEPEGFMRIFLNEGPPIAALLAEAARQGSASAYVRRLRAAFGEDKGAATVAQSIAEPLSDRELEVLRLLGSELTGPEIARELMISLNTLRTHTKNIYSKLGAHNRREAVGRAAELEIL